MSIEYGDQTIVHFLEDPENAMFGKTAWPLHVTLSPWFNVPMSRHDEFSDELRIIAHRWKPMVADIEGRETFGRSIPGTLIGANALKAFRYNLVNVITKVGGVLRDTDLVGGIYRPHILHANYDILPYDKPQVKVDSLSVVEVIDNPPTDREITNTYKLEGLK